MASWLKTSDEVRANNYSIENPSTPIAKALMMLGGEKTITGRPMNDGRALSLSPIFNAVTVIAGDLATIPLKVYRRSDRGREEETGHPLSELLEFEPTAMVTSAAWREASQSHVLLRGNCYTEIVSNSRGVITELVPQSPTDVVREGVTYKLVSEKRGIHAANMLHVAGPGGNGVDGWSVIKLARENWALASALEESNSRFISNASRPSGFLTTEASMKPETLKKIKDLWGKRNSGLDNIGGTPVLDGGFKWQQVGLSAEDAQFLQSREFSVVEIARWFNITPHKLQDLSRATFSNVEELAIAYVRNTLRPWAVRWEQAMNLKLLTQRERRAGLYVGFNLEGLLRGDIEARTAAYRSQFEMGALTPNEIRALEDRNPVEGGDEPFVRLDMVKLTQAGVPQEVQEKEPEPRAERREYRTHDRRMQLRSTYLPILLEGTQRMVRGEVRNVRRILQRTEPDQLQGRIEGYYFDEHPGFATSVMGPLFRSYAVGMSLAALNEVDSDITLDAGQYADTYTESFVARYSARSRRALAGLEAEAIEQRLHTWTEGDAGAAPRPQQVASEEVIKLGDAVARMAFIAAGVVGLIWRTVGDSCPYCVRLNGKRVDSRSSFIQAGEAFEGEGDVPDLVPSSNITHAPAHRGCNCIIIPGL